MKPRDFQKRNGAFLFFALVLALWVFGPAGATRLEAAVCEDFFCELGETPANCPADCGTCGDLVCDPYENAATCPSDCGPCGDSRCDGDEPDYCPEDCNLTICGDLLCEAGEDACPIDCLGGTSNCQANSDCDDGDACNGEEICGNGGCEAGRPLLCDDGDPCTADLCDRAQGCSHEPVPDSDGDGACDAVDACPSDPLNDADGDGVCGNQDNCPEISNVDQADSDADGIGDACEASGDTCNCCADTDIVAGKSYGPSRWNDGEFCGCRLVGFKIPAYIPVTKGNAGNHWLTLRLSVGGREITVIYKGGSNQANPNNPREIAKGLRYNFVLETGGPLPQHPSCLRARLRPGHVVQTDHVMLHIFNGSNRFGPTEVTMPLVEDQSSGCLACSGDSGGEASCQ